MAATVHLDIVSAEKSIFSGLTEMVVASGTLGEIGVVPGHAPLITSLKAGEVRVTKPGGEHEVFFISGGMLEVQPHSVTVLADEAERADSLDEAAAIQARERAEEILRNRDANFDFTKASAELARAAAMVSAIKKARKHIK